MGDIKNLQLSSCWRWSTISQIDERMAAVNAFNWIDPQRHWDFNANRSDLICKAKSVPLFWMTHWPLNSKILCFSMEMIIMEGLFGTMTIPMKRSFSKKTFLVMPWCLINLWAFKDVDGVDSRQLKLAAREADHPKCRNLTIQNDTHVAQGDQLGDYCICPWSSSSSPYFSAVFLLVVSICV